MFESNGHVAGLNRPARQEATLLAASPPPGVVRHARRVTVVTRVAGAPSISGERHAMATPASRQGVGARGAGGGKGGGGEWDGGGGDCLPFRLSEAFKLKRRFY